LLKTATQFVNRINYC